MSQAHPNSEYHKMHSSFIIRGIREIRGFYFPFEGHGATGRGLLVGGSVAAVTVTNPRAA